MICAPPSLAGGLKVTSALVGEAFVAFTLVAGCTGWVYALTVATQFMVAGLANGETGVIAVFEEYPEEYLARAETRNKDVGEAIRDGKLARFQSYHDTAAAAAAHRVE